VVQDNVGAPSTQPQSNGRQPRGLSPLRRGPEAAPTSRNPLCPPRDRASTSTVVTRLALMLAIIVGLAPVLSYLTYSHTRIADQLDSSLKIQALALTDFIAAHPKTWSAAPDRLLDNMDRYLPRGDGFTVRDSEDRTVLRLAPTRRGPFITRIRTIYALDHAHGSIEAQVSVFNELLLGLVVFGTSLVCVWLLWGPIRGLPLAALAVADRNLRARDRYQRALLNNFPFLVWLKDVDSRYLAVNAKFLEVIGHPSEDTLIGKADADIAHPKWASILRNDGQDGQVDSPPRRMEEWTEVNGQRRCFEIYKSLVSLDDHVVGTVGYARDITPRKQDEEELIFRALHDPLTGLANRSLCMDRITQANERALHRSGPGFAVIFMDLDRFKAVNDSLGHEAGDELLREVGTRLAACARRMDTVCRYGGDEFILVLEGMSPRQTMRTIKRIRESLNEPVRIGTHEMRLKASYGVVYAPMEGSSPEDLLRNANIALHQAKHCGRNRVVVFKASMHETAIQMMSLQGEMRQGLAAGEFFMVYQTVFDLEDNSITGFEALMRWRHPQRGLVPPSEFITLAEESGFIFELGHFALAHACKDMAALLRTMPEARHLNMSVNLSPRQFSRQGLTDQIRHALEDNCLQPSSLMLEITESSMMRYPTASAHILARLKAKGVGIAIDDFGTGYSSMSALQRLPLDRLKIDMSFVEGMTESIGGREIVRAIITLAHSLHLQTVAEGIETEAQQQLLRELGCDLGQGYLCSQPMVVADLPAAIRKGAHAKVA